MSVLYPPETEYAKERVKWEAQNSELGPGKRPYVYREWPSRIYLAGRPANGLGPITSACGFPRAWIGATAFFPASRSPT